MRLYPIICAALLAGCGPNAAPIIPPDLLQSCAGWTGKTPATEGELVDAILAERRGRLICSGQIDAIKEILDR